MNVLIALPQRDATLRPRAPEGFRLHDLSAAFWSRVAGATGVGAILERWRTLPFEPGRAQALLTGSVASALLSRTPDLHERLWGIGAALGAFSAELPQLRLQLDDLHLTSGSTECPADIVAAAKQSAPWKEELDEALRVADGAERVALWLDRDQQLPIAEAFASSLSRPERLELWGPFAVAQEEGLRRLPGLGRARVVDTPCEVEVVAPPGHPDRPALLWIEEGTSIPTEPWAGRVGLDALGRISAETCRAVCFAFCGVTGETVIGVDGRPYLRAGVDSAIASLRAQGIRVLAEWWVGAPGQDEQRHLDTARELTLAGWPLAGLRTFHWTRGRAPGRFGELEVTLRAVEEARALFRAHPFEAEGSVDRSRLPEVFASIQQALGSLSSRVPGRIGAAYAFEPETPPGSGLRFARGAAIVALPFRLDGGPGPAHYAASLVTGTVLALDARLAPALARLDFSQLSADKRAAVVRSLVARQILRELP